MALRRYTPLNPSRGTVIPADIRQAVHERDLGCVGATLGWPSHRDKRGIELDHVRASHGLGMKSATELGNLVALCNDCHRYKTDHGREARPLLLAYLRGETP
jgi:5-methylcytosine-specific restriction endonuclease McrA